MSMRYFLGLLAFTDNPGIDFLIMLPVQQDVTTLFPFSLPIPRHGVKKVNRNAAKSTIKRNLWSKVRVPAFLEWFQMVIEF